jgi:hypothetical protein
MRQANGVEDRGPALAIAAALLYRELETGVGIEELVTCGLELAKEMRQILISRERDYADLRK